MLCGRLARLGGRLDNDLVFAPDAGDGLDIVEAMAPGVDAHFLYFAQFLPPRGLLMPLRPPVRRGSDHSSFAILVDGHRLERLEETPRFVDPLQVGGGHAAGIRAWSAGPCLCRLSWELS